MGSHNKAAKGPLISYVLSGSNGLFYICLPCSQRRAQHGDYHSKEEGWRSASDIWAAVTEIKVAVAELLRPFSIAICLTFFIINFVFRGAAPASDASLYGEKIIRGIILIVRT